MDVEWKKYNPSFVSNRYNYIAPVYPFFEWVFLLPKSIRRKTVSSMGLHEGDTVIEIGCGTGKNLKLLSEAVGESGTVLGVDVSPGMLEKADSVKTQYELSNVELMCTDAAKLPQAKKINGALFSLSYATMIERKLVLKNVWEELEHGGRVVIMDAQYPPGIAGKLIAPVKPVITLFLRATVLGNPHIKPIEELKEVAGSENVSVEMLSMGSYFVAYAEKK